MVVLFATSAHAKVKVVTTLADLASIARSVGGEHVEASSMAKGYQDPHKVDAKPSFILDLSRADLVALIGMDLEIAWLGQLLEASRNPRIQKGGAGYVDCSQGMRVLERPSAVSRAEGDIHVYGNPHYWLDPANAKIIAANIAAGLKRVDAKNAGDYDRNLNEFNAKIDDLLRRTETKMRPFRGARIVAYHNTWPYLGRRYGIEFIDFLENKPGIPPSGAHLAQLIPKMKAEGVKVILKEVFFTDAVPNSIASKTGAKVVEIPSSVGGVKGADDYFALIDLIIDRITAALK